jgi:hypothetical protein
MLFWALIWGGKIAPKKEEKNRKMHSAMNGRELLADMESNQPSDLEIHCGFKNAKNDVRNFNEFPKQSRPSGGCRHLR